MKTKFVIESNKPFGKYRLEFEAASPEELKELNDLMHSLSTEEFFGQYAKAVQVWMEKYIEKSGSARKS